jgi:serine protease Do
MNQSPTRRGVKAAGTAAALAAVGFGGYAWQKQAVAQSPSTSTPTPPAVSNTPALRDAATLQNAFSQVAKTAEPAVVTIINEPKRPRVASQNRQYRMRPFGGSPFGGGQDSPFGGDRDPFEEFFRRFRDFGFTPNSAAPEQRSAQNLFRPTQDGPEEGRGGLGSGFIYDKSGLIMTNAHVVRGAQTVDVKMADGREFKNAKVLGYDTQADIAVVKVNATNLPSVSLGDSSKIDVGDWAIAVGNPFGLSNTLTVGVISAKAREVPLDVRSPGDYLQTDASINPGNSGGPLLDIYGRVVGVNNAIYSPSGGNVGIGFAIPINTARDIANTLAKEGRVRRARLGVGITDAADSAAALGLPAGTTGVLVQSVEPNGPAARAGLQPGDIIQKFNGESVTRAPELQRKVNAAPIGQDATLTVLRGGKTLTLNARLEELKDPSQPSARAMQDIPPPGDEAGSNGLGIRISPLTPDLAQRLSVSAGTQGVVIAGVADNSPAAEAGLRPGDVILRVGQKAVTAPAEVQSEVKRILATQSGDKKVALYVTRGGQSSYVFVSLND